MSPRHQEGTLFVIGDTCYLKYRITELKDGTSQRVHKTIQLCKRSDLYTWWKKKGKWGFSSAVHDLRRKTMDGLRTEIERAEPSNGDAPGERADMRVVDFWEQIYLPYYENPIPLTGLPRRKPSTVHGYKQIWGQHLKAHFSTMMLKEYEPVLGNRFLRSLTGKQGKTTLKHIKAVASSIFSYAVDEEILKLNPWREVNIPQDAIESEATKHYTLAEAEDIISSLVDHVDCQLVMALSCFLALRPNEIAALRWEDFDTDWVHIRRGVVRGIVGTPKTLESCAPVPLIDQVRVPLELWRQKCGNPSEGYVFESRNGTPVDLHNLISRVIIPHVEGNRKCVPCTVIPKKAGVSWKGLYSGRRGAITNVIENSNGNFAVGQALGRHKSGKTTLDVYKKQITPAAFKAGMKLLEAAANSGK
jgi:integrase